MSAGALRLIEAAPEDAARWDAYVEKAGEASLFHLFGWRRVIKAAYGYEAVYLMAEREDRIVGVLPLIDVRSGLFGRNLISTAFTVGGGVAADDEEARGALARAAVEEGRKRRVGYVELRSQRAALEGWTVKKDVYAGFAKEAAADEAKNLAEIPKRRRADLRKGLNALSAGELAADFDSDPDIFYALYAEAARDHGTPVFPRGYLNALAGVFKDRLEILTIWAKGKPVAALASFYFRDRTMPYYIAARAEARAFRAQDLALWLAMRRGVARGAPVIDLGRSKYGAGSFDYKLHWGFAPAPLEYQYALIGAQETPNVNPDNPKFALAVSAWRRLPLPVANLAGPILARHLA